MNEFRSDGSVYEIEYKAGEGLTAEVFKAYRVDSRGFSRQRVALKILKAGTVSYLRQEFETLARVNSPHCVRVLAWENTNDCSALALEWIEGATLFEVACMESFDQSLIDELMIQVKTGLSDLALVGLCHGDLHPRNILLDTSGKIRLVDFASGPRGSKDGFIRGSPPYLSPAIWAGGEASIENDLFALELIAKDASDGFSSVPATPKLSRARAYSFCGCHEIQAPQSSVEARMRLAKIVARVLQTRAEKKVTTALLASLKLKPRKWEVAAAVILALVFASAVALPVRAEAPMFERSNARGNIAVHTNRWVHLTLNGREVGYAPFNIGGLVPGPHRLVWRGAQGSGSIQLNLKAGESLKLSDQDFRKR